MSYPGSPPGGEPQQPQYSYPDGVGYPPPQPPPQSPPPQQYVAPEPPPQQYPPQPQYTPVEQPGYAPGAAPVPSYPTEPPGGGYGGDYGYGQPVMQPTAAMPPISGAPPMSGPPMSGPPMSGPPISGAPMPVSGGFPGAPAPAPKRGMTTPILATLTALLLLAAGVMTALYFTKSSDLKSAKSTIATRNSTITDRDAQIKKLQTDLQAKSDELAKAKQDLTGSQNQTQELKKEKDTIKQCITLLGEAGDLQDKGDSAGAAAKEKQAKPICDQAFIYLGT
jgi:hypothetical protein